MEVYKKTTLKVETLKVEFWNLEFLVAIKC